MEPPGQGKSTQCRTSIANSLPRKLPASAPCGEASGANTRTSRRTKSLDKNACAPRTGSVKKNPPFTHLAGRLLATLVAGIAVGILGCDEGDKSSVLSARMEEAFAAGDHNRAEIACKNLLRLDPSSRPAMRTLGHIWLERGSPRIAATYFASLCKLDPANADDQAALSMAILFVGDLPNALDHACKALGSEPAHPLALFVLAVASADAERMSGAEKKLDLIGEADGGAALPLARAIIALRRGEMEAARGFLGRAEMADPANSKVHVWKAEWHRAAKEADAAEECLKEAVRLAPARSPERIAYATFLQTRGKRDQAVALLQASVKDAPDFIAAWRMLANDAMAREDREAAAKALTAIFAKDSLDFEAVMLQSKLWLSEGGPAKCARAVSILERLESVYPKSPPLALQLARARLATGDKAAAIRSLDHALKIAPDFREALLMKAGLELGGGSDPTMAADLGEWLRKHPDDHKARLAYSGTLHAIGRTQEAIDVLRPFATDARSPRELRLHFGLLLLEIDKPGEARGVFERVLEDFPTDQTASTELVKLDMASGRKAEALQRAARQISDHPGSPAARHLQAAVFADSGLWAEAEAALAEALKLDPDHQGAHELLAKIHGATGKVETSKLHWEKVRAGDPSNLRAVMELAAIHERQGARAESRKCYEEILAKDPDFVPALGKLAEIHASDSPPELSKARSLAERAHSLKTADPAIAATLGWVLFQEGEFAKARVLLDQAANAIKPQPQVLFRLGKACLATADEAGALAAFRQALAAGESFPGRSDAEAGLARLEKPVAPGSAGVAELAEQSSRDPVDLISRLRLAEALAAAGLHAEAAEACAGALKINPELHRAHLLLARLAFGPLGDDAKASEHAAKARELKPDDAEAAAILGTLAFREGDHARAEPLLRDGLAANRSDSGLLLRTAQAAYRIGKQADSVTLVEELLRDGKDSAAAAEGRRFLAFVSGRASAEEVAAALAEDPGDIVALMARASSAEKDGRVQEALADYRKAQLLDPFFPQAREALVRLTATEPKR